MPKGLYFQRRHPVLGYKIKFMYYFFKRRDILQKKISLGNLNANNIIYVVKPDFQDKVEGLLSLLYRQVLYIDYARSKGYLPFVDWKNFPTQYSDDLTNSWEYFFRQPTSLKEEEVYKSKNVYFSGWTWRNINVHNLFESDMFYNSSKRDESHRILVKNLQFNSEINDMVRIESEILKIEECIGVYIRGTDYVKLRPSGEYIQPEISQVKEKITEFLSKYNSPIFLVTEDGSIYDELSNEFDNIKLVSYDSFIRNYEGSTVLSKSQVLDSDKKRRGQQYLVKMILLSKCKYLISSITQGSKFSYALNGGRYQDEYIFDLGLYK